MPMFHRWRIRLGMWRKLAKSYIRQHLGLPFLPTKRNWRDLIATVSLLNDEDTDND